MKDLKSGNKLLLPILWPFAGLISSLKNWRQPWAMNVFWMVCIYLGAIQIFCPAGHVLGDGADGGRYALKLIEMHSSHRGLLEQIAYNFMETNAMDYYQIIVTWIVSLVTDNAHVLFACFAAVFGSNHYLLQSVRSSCAGQTGEGHAVRSFHVG